MNEAFLDSKVMQIINHIADMVLASILWTMCSLPIITMGVATASLVYTYRKCILDGGGGIVKTFFFAFRQNLKQGYLPGMVLIVPTILGLLLMRVLIDFDEGPLVMPFFATSCYVSILLMIQLYLYPLLGTFELTVRQMFSVCFTLIFRHLGKSLLLLLLFILAISLIEGYPLLLLIVPSAFVFATSPIYSKMFARYINISNKRNTQIAEGEVL